MTEPQPETGPGKRIALAREAAFSLGTMQVRPASCEVVVGGKTQTLQPRVMQVLVALSRRRGEVLSRDDLVTSCWEGLSVSEDAISRCIGALRRLSEQTSEAFAIETLARVGYRLTATESAPAADTPSAAPSHGAAVTIAVLPFVNMSSDPEQEYFADGITEDIITDLSRWQSLAVASRNSTFRFKGKPIDMQQLGRELGARFLVEGSVRRIGERIRITAQLVDAETGNHVWAERYDRPITDLFEVQDEVIRTIVGTVVGRLHANEAERLRRKPPSSLAAYDLTLLGNWLPWDNPVSEAEAKRAFERAIELDPGYGRPHSLLAIMLRNAWVADLSASNDSLDRAFALAQRGVELADNESVGHMILGFVCLSRGSFQRALGHVERSVEMNPANQWHQANFGYFLCQVGRAEEGIERLRNARRADPYFALTSYWDKLGFGQFVLRQYADALADFDRHAGNNPVYILGMMAGCCAKLGLSTRARELVAQCLRDQPGATAGKILTKIPFKQAGDSEHLAECLRLAGLPK